MNLREREASLQFHSWPRSATPKPKWNFAKACCHDVSPGLFASLIRTPISTLTIIQASDSVHVAAMTPSKKSWVIVSTGLVLLSFLFFISLPFFDDDIPPPTQQISKASFRAPKQNV